MDGGRIASGTKAAPEKSSYQPAPPLAARPIQRPVTTGIRTRRRIPRPSLPCFVTTEVVTGHAGLAVSSPSGHAFAAPTNPDRSRNKGDHFPRGPTAYSGSVIRAPTVTTAPFECSEPGSPKNSIVLNSEPALTRVPQANRQSAAAWSNSVVLSVT